MLEIIIPGRGRFTPEVLVLDYNGTLALDGFLLDQVKEKITALAQSLEIHIVTSDTFGSVTAQCRDLPVQIKVLETPDHTREKADYLDQFENQTVVAIGNGANDQLMLKKATLGIVVLGSEGCAGASLAAANILVKDIRDALDLFSHPQRLIATLRT